MLKEQMKRYGLIIHPEKSKIVFCRKNNEPEPKGVETSFVLVSLAPGGEQRLIAGGLLYLIVWSSPLRYND